jgi:uncharacterized membrane protein YuzA (DUF378 family)
MDWSAVNWVMVGLLGVFAFVASLVGNVVSLNNRIIGAIITALLFAVLYVIWTYYPHGIVLPGGKPG